MSRIANIEILSFSFHWQTLWLEMLIYLAFSSFEKRVNIKKVIESFSIWNFNVRRKREKSKISYLMPFFFFLLHVAYQHNENVD